MSRVEALAWGGFFLVTALYQGGLFVGAITSATMRARPWWDLVGVPTATAFFLCAWIYSAWWVSTRYPLVPGHWRRSLPRVVAAGLVCSAAATFIEAWANSWSPLYAAFRFGIPSGYLWHLADFAVCLLFVHVFLYTRRYFLARAGEKRLRGEMQGATRHRAEAERRAMEAAMNPRTLAATLDTVSARMRTDPDGADRMLAQLGSILRQPFAHRGEHEVPLWRELEELEPFLAIEQSRFDGRLRIAIDVSDDLMEALVPARVLRPLINRSLVAPGAGDSGTLRLSGRREGERLSLTITALCDVSLTTSQPRWDDDAMIASVHERLAFEYGGSAMLELLLSAPGESVMRLQLPLRDDAVEHVTRGTTQLTAERVNASRVRLSLPSNYQIAIFLALALFRYLGDRESTLLNGHGLSVWMSLIDAFVRAGVICATYYLAFYLTRRYPLVGAPSVAVAVGQSRRSAIARHLSAAVPLAFFGAVQVVVCSWAVGTFSWQIISPHLGRSAAQFMGMVGNNMLVYLFAALVAHAVEFARRSRSVEHATVMLDAELQSTEQGATEAELRALRAELNPHFVGNALHSASTLLRSDPDGAVRVLDQVRDLVERAVAVRCPQEVSLREELATLEPFIAMERSRLGARFVVSWNVDDDMLAVKVPHMILQPLLENAVKHGLASRQGAARIEIAAHRDDDCLELSVKDDGVSVERGHAAPRTLDGHGIGLSNTRERLAAIYGGSASFDLEPAIGGGTIARLLLPLRGSDSLSTALDLDFATGD